MNNKNENRNSLKIKGLRFFSRKPMRSAKKPIETVIELAQRAVSIDFLIGRMPATEP